MDNQYNYYVPEQNVTPEAPINQKEDKQPKKPFRMPKIVMILCFAVVFGVVGGAAFQTTNLIGNKIFGTTASNSKSTGVSTVPVTKTSSTVVSDVSDVVKNVMPSVVSITNMSVQQVQSFFGGTSEQESESTGSGIIVGQNDTELLIVTNNHVVEGSDTLTVSFVNDKSVEAQVKGTDTEKDLAVVAVQIKDIESDTMDAIAVATLGDSTKLQVGEPAIAIGNALGYGQSVTTGVISATDRDIQMEGFDTALIQTDAAINPGNSGGALVNANGEVIGINTVKVSSDAVEGMGYAIPISDANDTITKLMNQETKTKVTEAKKGYIGIKGVDVTTESAAMYNMPVGVYVSEAIEGGGAADAGITKGSIITSFEGTAIDSMATLQAQLEYYEAGTKVSLTIQVPAQDGSYTEQKVEVTLGSASN
ncbi:MAG: trypsin-like peptidase domain-containing protein [Lachnospiraceae bacterium]|nr:trypsin-like peptidase domain-containing protein [Lachnospiraceae bacterium]